MSIAGIGSVTGTSGTTYDFANMTNSLAMAAAKALGSEGKISPQAQAQINYIASGANMIAVNRATGEADQEWGENTQRPGEA